MRSTAGRCVVRTFLAAAAATLLALAAFAPRAFADDIPKGSEASNLHPIVYGEVKRPGSRNEASLRS
jgi:hypothetical protein